MTRALAASIVFCAIAGCGSSSLPKANANSRDPVSCSGDSYCIQDGRRVANPSGKAGLLNGSPCKWNKYDEGADNGSYRVVC